MLHKKKVSGGFYKKDEVVHIVYLRTQNGAADSVWHMCAADRTYDVILVSGTHNCPGGAVSQTLARRCQIYVLHHPQPLLSTRVLYSTKYFSIYFDTVNPRIC